jgi:hypothetical protein
MSDKWPWKKLWLVPDAEPEELFAVAALCRLIWATFEQEGKFPYGIRFGSSCFNAAGRLVPGKNSKGLTCATFILAVFESMNIQLVHEQEWPVRTLDDRAWLESLRPFATPAIYERLKEEIDGRVIRIRPEEVSGACVHRSPCGFKDSSATSLDVLALLDAEG